MSDHHIPPLSRLARSAAAIAAAMLIGVSAPAMAQSLEAITQAEEAVYAAWEATPLTFREALFVTNDEAQFGDYEARPDAVFAQGEPIIVYAEPVGFGWIEEGEGYRFGFDIDLRILSPEGTVLLNQPDFLAVAQESRARTRDFLLMMTLDLSGAEPGNYRLEYTVRDIASEKSAPIALDFSIAAAASTGEGVTAPEAQPEAPAAETAPSEATQPAEAAPAAQEPAATPPATQG
jgi:hypothetical protein